jgi:hypothetical protein
MWLTRADFAAGSIGAHLIAANRSGEPTPRNTATRLKGGPAMSGTKPGNSTCGNAELPENQSACKAGISADRRSVPARPPRPGLLQPERKAVRIALPNHLRRRREKIFGPAPSHPLDRNAKARIWAAAKAYNATHRQGRQHQGPLTWATLRVLRVLLWRFHSADGGGRCFPGYAQIARAAECCRDSVAVAIKALEDAGLLDWVHRLTRIRRRERDLFGHWGSIWQVIRTSNGYRFLDPLDREPGRRGWFACKSENPPRPQNRDFKTPYLPVDNSDRQCGARPDGAQVMQGEPSQAPPVPPERPGIALQREHGSAVRTRLSPAEHAALIARLDTNPTKADWALYACDLDTMLANRSR